VTVAGQIKAVFFFVFFCFGGCFLWGVGSCFVTFFVVFFLCVVFFWGGCVVLFVLFFVVFFFLVCVFGLVDQRQNEAICLVELLTFFLPSSQRREPPLILIHNGGSLSLPRVSPP